jgi:hypothetical protein
MQTKRERELEKLTQKLAIAIDRLLACEYADGIRAKDEAYAWKWHEQAERFLGRKLRWE